MEEEVVLDCQVLQDGEASGKGRAAQWKQPHETTACYPAFTAELFLFPFRAFLVLTEALSGLVSQELTLKTFSLSLERPVTADSQANVS